MTLEDQYACVIELAQSFTATIEQFGAGNSSLADVEIRLAHLYALVLPLVEPALVSAEESETDVTYEEWKGTFDALGRRLPVDYYHDVIDNHFDPTATPQVALGSLADDLADCWRDVTRCLRSLEAGDPLSNVVWQLRNDFHGHWAHHAIHALTVIRVLANE